MKNSLFAALFFLISCYSSKLSSVNNCNFDQSFYTFKNIDDTLYSLELQSLGKRYLKFNLDSCKILDTNVVRIFGHVTYIDSKTESGQRSIENVVLREAKLVDQKTIFFKKMLGKSNLTGNCIIEIKKDKYDSFILFSDDTHNPTVMKISW